MTGPAAASTDPEGPYTTFRIALGSGVLGSLGATLAWIGWLAWLMRSVELLVTVLVGALLGVAVHWTRQYIRVARSERLQSERQPGATTAWPRRPLLVLSWAAGFGFVGLVTEHLVAHMAAVYLRPFLASLATLVPAGIIIGWSMSRGRASDDNAINHIVNGIVVGAAITVATGILWTIGFGSTPWFPLLCWWGLVGIGIEFVAPPGRHGVRFADPIAAIILAFVATSLLDLLPANRSAYERFGALGTVPMIVRTMAAEVRLSPGMPATFWSEAETRYQAERAADSLRLLPRSSQPASIPRAAPPPPPPSRLDLKRAVDDLVAPPTAEELSGRPKWTEASWTQFVRSWLLMLFFAAGVGAAPAVERSLRPIDYPRSETFRKDLALSIGVLTVLLGACVVARLYH